MGRADLPAVNPASQPPPRVFLPTRPAAPPVARKAEPEVELRPLEDEAAKKPFSAEEARKEIELLNKVLVGISHRLKFGLYEETGQFFVQLVDRESNEVIKMMPPEHLLELRAKLQEAMGTIIDEWS